MTKTFFLFACFLNICILRVGLQLKIDEYDRRFSVYKPSAMLIYEPKSISKMLLVSGPAEFGMF